MPLRIAGILMGIGVAIYIFWDCYKKEQPIKGLLWATASLIFPITPLFYFTIGRPKGNHTTSKPMILCPKCGTENKSLTCKKCKNSLELAS